MKAMDIAGGTGRFMTFFRDNYPEMDVSLLDLSPFYLEAAGKNDRYYKKWFNNFDNRKKDIELKPLKLIQGKAEDMADITDDSFDILTCVYLFHELPNEVRRQVVSEMFRVLKPGGIISFNDSIQEGDRKDRTSLGIFAEKYNEPYYVDFINDNLNSLFFDAGFKPGPTSPIIASSSKVMSWIKPSEDDTPEIIASQ